MFGRPFILVLLAIGSAHSVAANSATAADALQCSTATPLLNSTNEITRWVAQSSSLKRKELELKIDKTLENLELDSSARSPSSRPIKNHLEFLVSDLQKKKDGSSQEKSQAVQNLLKDLRPKRKLHAPDQSDYEDNEKMNLHDPFFNRYVDSRGVIVNPYYDLQLKLVNGLINSPAPTGFEPLLNPEQNPSDATFLSKSLFDSFRRQSHSVIIIPDDKGHQDDPKSKQIVRTMLAEPSIDWIALEMLSLDLQPVVDKYIQSSEDSSAFNSAEKTLKNYFLHTWDRNNKKDGEPSLFFPILQEARRLKKQVIALDASLGYDLSDESNSFVFAGFLLRNYLWASAVPSTGRGILFGGNAHFLDRSPWSDVSLIGIRVQDYLKRFGHKSIYWLWQDSELGQELLKNPDALRQALTIRSQMDSLETIFDTKKNHLFGFLQEDFKPEPKIKVPIWITPKGKVHTHSKVVKNPHLSDEEFVLSHWSSAKPRQTVDELSKISNIESLRADDIVVVADDHARLDPKLEAKKLISNNKIEWFGIEMLPRDFQPVVDQFLKAPEGSRAFLKAKKTLEFFFSTIWTDKLPEKERNPDPYMEILLKAKRLQKPVIALDAESSYCFHKFVNFFGYSFFHATVRSYLWSQVIPKNGSGVVFGGAGHFYQNEPPEVSLALNSIDWTFQDFVRLESNRRVLFWEKASPDKFMPPAVPEAEKGDK